MANQFIAGNTYTASSICDRDAVWTFTVISRTASSLKLRDADGKVTTKKVYDDGLNEFCFPLGKYSMAPRLRTN